MTSNDQKMTDQDLEIWKRVFFEDTQRYAINTATIPLEDDFQIRNEEANYPQKKEDNHLSDTVSKKSTSIWISMGECLQL